MSDDSLTIIDEQALSTANFRTEIVDKIRQIAEREQARQSDTPSDLRASVREVLEEFQTLIIQRNIWIRIYDDNEHPLPTFSQNARRVVSELLKGALQRHQTGKTLAYVEVSFVIGETATVVTIEDNAPSPAAKALVSSPLLERTTTASLPGGFTLQAAIKGDAPHQQPASHLSVRSVTGCFTRCSFSFPH
ncbi:MAG: hypothetical protein WA958_20225 [Tunicatimonas sp.]